MKTLVDIVNVNGEASCLSSKQWLSILKGGNNSAFFQWLKIYVEYKKKVTLGLTGSTIVDMVCLNPESIRLINQHPEIFEIILRPFSHDIALLRTIGGFDTNLYIGEKVIRREFKNITKFFLPPEFMLTNEQIVVLKQRGMEGVFVNSQRFSKEVRDRIPNLPYEVKGVQKATLGCIPVEGSLTPEYLYSLHNYTTASWNKRIDALKTSSAFSWRDGESPFLIPDGVSREEFWIKNESQRIKRMHLRDLKLTYVSQDKLSDSAYKSYPVHSFSAWMEGFRMIGFLRRTQAIEDNLKRLTPQQLILWLSTIGSDILSAVEKKSPSIRLKLHANKKKYLHYVIQRSERGFEGEEFLHLLEGSLNGSGFPKAILKFQEPHFIKLKNRFQYLLPLIKERPLTKNPV